MAKQLLSAFGNKVLIVNPYIHDGGVSITDPTDIAGLECWYDGTDLSTLWTDAGSTQVTSANDLVYQWDDKSGNGYTLTQITSTFRPKYQTAGIQFDGTNDYIFNAALRNPSTLTGTVFVVFNQAPGRDSVAWSNSGSGSTVTYSIHVPNHDNPIVGNYATLRTRASGTSYVATLYSEDQTHDDNNNHVQTTQISNGDNELWIDGSSFVTNTDFISESVNLNRYTIGALIRTTIDSYFAGYVLGVIYYTSVLSDADRQAVEAWCTSHYSI